MEAGERAVERSSIERDSFSGILDRDGRGELDPKDLGPRHREVLDRRRGVCRDAHRVVVDAGRDVVREENRAGEAEHGRGQSGEDMPCGRRG